MREKIKDPLRLDHILDSINKIISFKDSIDFEKVLEKDIVYFGLIKLLEIIGEAAYMITPEFKNLHPETPWNEIVRMRHILVHGYYCINKKDVIKTINEDLPELKKQIEGYIKEFE